jgi:hypothetical protein
MPHNPTGALSMEVNGQPYTLHFGISAMAAVQAKHGADFDDLVLGKTGAVPNLSVIHDILAMALRRYHPAEAGDPYFVDDLIAQNPGALAEVMAASSPDAPDASAEGKAKPRRR